MACETASSTRSSANIDELCALTRNDDLGVPLQRARLHGKPEAISRILEKPPRYVFGVSTGHAGSTSLSDRASYEGKAETDKGVLRNFAGRGVLFNFEAEGILYPFRDVPYHFGKNEPLPQWLQSMQQWQHWWAKAPSFEDQVAMVRDHYKVLVDAKLEEAGASTYVDLGHQNLEGILRATPQVFGQEDILIVRLRRSRVDTVRSFMESHSSLCGYPGTTRQQWTLCPPENRVILGQGSHSTASSAKWSPRAWTRLDQTQQHFWYVDEVEAQWQQVMAENPDGAYLECDWVDDLRPCFQAVAALLDLQASNGGDGAHLQHHTEGDLATDHAAKLRKQDEAYQRHMRYSDALQDAIRRVQF